MRGVFVRSVPSVSIGGFATLAVFAVAGCGSNNADVPQGLLDAIKNQGSQSGYPAGPYGNEVGSTVKNYCFQGWKDPSVSNYDPAQLEQVCLADFYDSGSGGSADGGFSVGSKLLLLNSSALWCTACRYEYGGSEAAPSLGQDLMAREAKGFRILGTLFQDLAAKAATPEDAAVWAQTYDVTFPFAADTDFEMGTFFSATLAPFNMLIDTRTMHIVLELPGNDATLITSVDDYLDKNP
jgi:hypothetical protein